MLVSPVLSRDLSKHGIVPDGSAAEFMQITILQGIRVVLDGLIRFLDVVWSDTALVVDMPLKLLLRLPRWMGARSPMLFRQEWVPVDTRGRSRW
jgi:lipopolysaccharide/colanic/teichoic acid biosynthesis glycosyltransferase